MTILIPAWVDGRLVEVEKLDAHRRGLRHKAVSVFVLRGDEILLQRRAPGKYHSPGLWANTCCTHPAWSETAQDCAARRLSEELGLADLALRPAGMLEYRADVGQGMIEHEVVELFLGRVERRVLPRPDPAEVMDLRWIRLERLLEAVARRPAIFTPWLRIYLGQGDADMLRQGPDIPRLLREDRPDRTA